MRLKKIKMAGFKSFVDPTNIIFPSDMVAVVGPNGCGKSNIIDAVRWVMGASSRHLRGDTMDDVIFNGSSSRKPVGQASIELAFDNTQGRVGGEFARYNEISIRRLVARDGQSKYFLNGTRCRQRDIKDIFLGTGLGPKSYAIIEQGMISRLIEAKPEELRVYVEEAAGISKYKERRRETENRIRHTRENMDRLNDLRAELEKQLRRLKRQANTAQRYKQFKQQERRLKAELLALRWQALEQDEQVQGNALKQHDTLLQGVIARLRSLEANIEKQRETLIEANESFNEVQGRYYRLGGDISGVEQSIQHGKVLRARQIEELQQARQAHEQNRRELAGDHQQLARHSDEMQVLEPRLEQARIEHDQSAEKLSELEQTLDQWQQRWEELAQRLSIPSETVQVERARIEQLERQITQLGRREVRLKEELSALVDHQLHEEIEQFEAIWTEAKQVTEEHDEVLRGILDSIDRRREQNRELNRQWDQARSRLQALAGRLTSLEALQEAALGKRQGQVIEWLQHNDLGSKARLGEQLRVETGWEGALEMVMGQYLEAVCIDNVDVVSKALGSLDHGQLMLLDVCVPSGAPSSAAGKDTLLSKVQASLPLNSLLDGIYIACDLEQALAMRQTLAANESIVTVDGLWIGPNWLRVVRDPDEHAGVLAREKEIESLTGQVTEIGQSADALELELAAGRESLTQLEQDREQIQARSHQSHRTQTEAESRLHRHRLQLEQVVAREARLNEELDELQGHYRQDETALQQASQRRNQALEQLEALSTERESLNAERQMLNRVLDETRSLARERREGMHQLALRQESVRSAQQSTRQAIGRMEGQLLRLQQQMDTLQHSLDESIAPLKMQQQELDDLLARRVQIERALNEARSGVQSVEAAMREQDQQRLGTEKQIEELRSEQDRRRMAWQEISVRCRTLREQVSESGFELQVLLEELEQGADLSSWEQGVQEISRKIERLGPINLAAIDEYQEQNQRKEYLDSQLADLNEALETLETAIRKIDKETRHRFKETFESVNERLQSMFPRLFGGGEAHLTLTGDDLLSTGVSIMARPPGKRLSTIHLMSGGEKALTAVAMVFAIFELNPAPFCLLDEVDAPLDETNVDRFCEVVKEMSESVQFIFITHNKITMEYANQLIGVTMHEPGVSRLVAVDMEEAVQMAAG
ncbi:MAG: chromosome segregation protein SMC [Pseudomonadota bacterium]